MNDAGDEISSPGIHRVTCSFVQYHDAAVPKCVTPSTGGWRTASSRSTSIGLGRYAPAGCPKTRTEHTTIASEYGKRKLCVTSNGAKCGRLRVSRWTGGEIPTRNPAPSHLGCSNLNGPRGREEAGRYESFFVVSVFRLEVLLGCFEQGTEFSIRPTIQFSY